jgi:hypothetical protein
MSDTLTPEDRLLIDIVLVGCTKVISMIIHEDPKQYAKRLSKEYIKSNLDTFVRLRYLSKQKKDDRQTFRPYDIRENIPEDLKKLKNIQAGDLRRILKSLRRTNVIASQVDKDHIVALEDNRRRPSMKNDKPSGVDSPYQTTQFYNKMKKLLTKSSALDLVHHLLLESGMLYRYSKCMELIYLYVIKINHDRDKAWNICKSVFPKSSTETDFDKLYKQMHSTDNFSDNKVLEEQASEKAKLVIGSHPPDYFIGLYEIGGQFFKA